MSNELKYIYVHIQNERRYKAYTMYRNYGLYMDVYVFDNFKFKYNHRWLNQSKNWSSSALLVIKDWPDRTYRALAGTSLWSRYLVIVWCQHQLCAYLRHCSSSCLTCIRKLFILNFSINVVGWMITRISWDRTGLVQWLLQGRHTHWRRPSHVAILFPHPAIWHAQQQPLNPILR